MKVREYTEQDQDQLLSLWWDSWHSSASFEHPQSRQAWKSRWLALAASHEVVVVDVASELAGFAALDKKNSILSQIFVAPAFKRKGIGTTLFHWAANSSEGRLRLKTLAENSESRAFYEKMGMTLCGKSVNDFNGREEVEYVL